MEQSTFTQIGQLKNRVRIWLKEFESRWPKQTDLKEHDTFSVVLPTDEDKQVVAFASNEQCQKSWITTFEQKIKIHIQSSRIEFDPTGSPIWVVQLGEYTRAHISRHQEAIQTYLHDAETDYKNQMVNMISLYAIRLQTLIETYPPPQKTFNIDFKWPENHYPFLKKFLKQVYHSHDPYISETNDLGMISTRIVL